MPHSKIILKTILNQWSFLQELVYRDVHITIQNWRIESKHKTKKFQKLGHIFPINIRHQFDHKWVFKQIQ
jgi:hypothetical protein